MTKPRGEKKVHIPHFYEFTCRECNYSVVEYVPSYQGSKLAGNPCPKCETSNSFIFEGSV